MNKLIPFQKLSKLPKKLAFLGRSFVISDKNKQPVGFVFGRESFIRFLETVDMEFEEKVEDPKKAHENPAGQLIDAIEERLSVNPTLVEELKGATEKTNEIDWIPFDDIVRRLHV